MNKILILEHSVYEGMFTSISCKSLLETAMHYNTNRIKNNREERNDCVYYNIDIDNFFQSSNQKVQLVISKETENNDISERDIVNALNFFIDNIDEMEYIAQAALYNHYIYNIGKEKPKAKKWLFKVMRSSDVTEVLSTLDQNDFKDLYLAYLDSLFIDSDGILGMMLYTNWDTPVAVGFYDVKSKKIVEKHGNPYLYLTDYYSDNLI